LDELETAYNFELCEVLGQGAFATVISARNRITRDEFAIKVLDALALLRSRLF